MLIALAAGLVIPILAGLLTSGASTLAGMATFASFQRAFGDTLRLGALVTFAIAATQFSFGRINSA